MLVGEIPTANQNQLAIYKRGRGFELGITVNHGIPWKPIHFDTS